MRALLLFTFALTLQANTIVQQTVKNPDGSLAAGIVHIKNSTMCTTGSSMLGNAVITVRFTAGAFSVSLIPNDTCTPTGSAYSVSWQLSGGQAFTEWWRVPTSGSPVTVDSVRVTVPPAINTSFNPSQLTQAGATTGMCLIWSGTSWGPEACAAANAVSSIFGRTGAVVAASGDYTTALVTESGNLYFTQARSRAALSASLPLLYNSSTGVFTCPSCGTSGVTSAFGRAGVVVAVSGDYDTDKVTEATSLYFTQARARAALSGVSPISYNSSTGAISCPSCGTATGDMDKATYDPANSNSQVEVIAHKNAASGYAGLDGSQKISISLIPTGSTGSTVPFGNDARFSDARTPTAHATSHQNGGSDEVATASPAAFAIPKAGSGGKLAAGWIPATAGGVVVMSSGVGAPIAACVAPSSTNLEEYVNTSNGDLYYCSATNTWKKIVIPTGNVATATALAANGGNCSAGQFPLGVDASGAAESCTALPTTIAGTADQITASASTGPIVLSIPTNPTLPGTTTGTFSGNLTGAVTGNSSTATALAANGTNCGAGNYPLGVDASGNAEGCTAASGAPLRAITFTFDGGGSALTSGATAYARVPFACTIVDWSISSTTAETVTLKTWKKATGTALPTVSDSISTSGVSLSTGTHVRSTTVSDFTTASVTANDIVAANITAVTASTWVQFTIGCQQ